MNLFKKIVAKLTLGFSEEIPPAKRLPEQEPTTFVLPGNKNLGQDLGELPPEENPLANPEFKEDVHNRMSKIVKEAENKP